MGTSKQRPVRRYALQAIDAGDKFLTYVLALKEAFEPSHPEYIPLLEAISQMIIMAQISMGDFFERAWHRRPPNDPRG